MQADGQSPCDRCRCRFRSDFSGPPCLSLSPWFRPNGRGWASCCDQDSTGPRHRNPGELGVHRRSRYSGAPWRGLRHAVRAANPPTRRLLLAPEPGSGDRFVHPTAPIARRAHHDGHRRQRRHHCGTAPGRTSDAGRAQPSVGREPAHDHHARGGRDQRQHRDAGQVCTGTGPRLLRAHRRTAGRSAGPRDDSRSPSSLGGRQGQLRSALRLAATARDHRAVAVAPRSRCPLRSGARPTRQRRDPARELGTHRGRDGRSRFALGPSGYLRLPTDVPYAYANPGTRTARSIRIVFAR